MKDPLADHYQEIITAIQPCSTWGDFRKERQQLNNLARKTDLLFQSGIPYDDKYQAAEAIVTKFIAMKQLKHWKVKDKPIIPSSVVTFRRF